MKKQLFLISLVSGLFLSTALKSQQINTDFSSTLGLWSASGSAGLSLNSSTGMATLSNYNGATYTTNDCRMIYTASMTFGGTSDKYVLLKEQDIAGSANLMFQLRIGSNDYSVYAPSATGYASTKPISRFVIPGTNTVLCLGRVKQMFFGSTQFPYASNTSVVRMQYYHLPTSGSSLNTYTTDFIKSYVDSTAVFGSTEMDAAKFDVDFKSSTYLTGFAATPTALAQPDAENIQIQSSASGGSSNLAYLTYQPAAPFLWTFSKENALVFKVNKQSITNESQIKLTVSVPSTISPYTVTSFEYATPLSSVNNYPTYFSQINIPGTNDYYLIFDLDGLTCGTSGAPTISSLKSQNSCTATKLQFLLNSGLQASEAVKIDFIKPFATKADAFSYVSTAVSGSATLNGTATTGSFTTTYGTASNSQTFAVSGSNLSASIVATAPTGYEVSSNYGGSWGSTASFAQTSGLASGNLKIRLKSTAAVTGSYNSQNIVLSSTGATSVNISTPSSGNLVTIKALTAITSPVASNKVYDGNTTATITGIFTALVGSDDVYLTGSYADANAGNGKTVTASATLGGTQASNYTFTGTLPTGLSANITQASQIITFGSLPSGKTVGEDDFAPGATSATSGINPIIYSTSNSAVASIVSNQIHIVGVGTCAIYADQASSTNYNAATQASQSITIAARPVIVLGSNATSADLTNPIADISVPANADLTIGADRTIHNISIERGGKVTLNNGYSLTVNDININSDASGTGTFVDKNATNAHGLTVNGTSTVQQYVTSTAKGVTGRNWYISSPVSAALSSTITTATTNDLVSYTESTGQWINAGTTMDVMKGYIALSPAQNTTLVFSGGSLNTGTQSVSNLSYTGATKKGFNLLGNPYPSYLDWDAATISNVLTTVWYRSKSTGAYLFQTYNSLGGLPTATNGGTNLIPPMQAFWVRATSSTNSVSFDNSMRSHLDQNNAINRLKSPSKTNSVQQVLRLAISNGVNTDETVLYSNPNALNGADNYDSPKMTNANVTIPELYTLVEGEQMVINGLNTIPYNTEIPLGFTTGQTNSFTIKTSLISNFELGTQIVLNDNLLNVQQDLSIADYSFTSDAVSTSTRFTLTFKAPSVATGINTENKEKILISTRNGHIIVNGTVNRATLEIFNTVGQKVISRNLSGTNIQENNNLPVGAYFVKLTNDGKCITKKIIID